ncbi:hypothetical protein PMAYCL1PPCAC_21956, partial [Pristionchus mayeri]
GMVLLSQLSLFICVFQCISVHSWNPSPALRAAIVDPSQLDEGMPQQVHIALTKKNTEMSATWLTFENVTQQLNFRKVFTMKTCTVQAETTKFVNPTGWVRYIHRAVMTGLTPGESYAYQVGRPGYLSKEFVFKQLPLQPPYNIMVFGDLGVYNGESIPTMLQEAEKRTFDLLVTVGDYAYDLFSNNGTVGDQYFATLEPLFATVPYMVVAGNHEAEETFKANYSTYRNSFTMPDEGYGDNQFYSFDLGPIHFVGLSSEFYAFYPLHGQKETIFTQYNWLVKDLEVANKNRNFRPWIFAFFHRPFYCSNTDEKQCNEIPHRLLRDGHKDIPGLEQLFIDQGVDISFTGHEHSYERFLPRTPSALSVCEPLCIAYSLCTNSFIVGKSRNEEVHWFTHRVIETIMICARRDRDRYIGFSVQVPRCGCFFRPMVGMT